MANPRNLANIAPNMNGSGGNVGIGTATPAKPLNVVSSATTEVWVESTSTQKAILSLSAGDTSVGITSTYNSGGSAARPFIFYNVSTPLLQFDAGKSVALQGASTQTGTGITFPATQSASTNANTLDDYEEGTWTPEIRFGSVTTGMSQTGSGRYIKVGRVVYITGTVGVTNKGSASGPAQIYGLPFVSNGSGMTMSIYIQNGQIVPSSGVIVQLYSGVSGDSTIDINSVTQSTGVDANVTNSNFGTTGTLRLTGTYDTTN